MALSEYLTDSTDIFGKPMWGWCVYVLECHWRPLPSGPDYVAWKYAASKANRRLYVGSTNNIEQRMEVHGDNPGVANWRKKHKRGSEFTYHFPPKELESVTFCKSKSEARRKEEEIADGLDTMSGVFVWQN